MSGYMQSGLAIDDDWLVPVSCLVSEDTQNTHTAHSILMKLCEQNAEPSSPQNEPIQSFRKETTALLYTTAIYLTLKHSKSICPYNSTSFNGLQIT